MAFWGFWVVILLTFGGLGTLHLWQVDEAWNTKQWPDIARSVASPVQVQGLKRVEGLGFRVKDGVGLKLSSMILHQSKAPM